MGFAALCLSAAAAKKPLAVAPEARMYFEPNAGQPGLPEDVRFFTRDGGVPALFTDVETVLAGNDSKDQPVRMRFPGGAKLRFTGEGELPGISAYFIGNDKSKWIGRVPHYSKIRAKDVYPGIDLVYYANERNELEYDFVVSPGADPKRIEISFGNSPIKFDTTGGLLLGSGIAQKKARVHQGAVEVAADYKVDGGRVRFTLGEYDRTRELIIDPVLFLRLTNGPDCCQTFLVVKFDANNNIYAAGETSTPYPTLNAFRATQSGGEAVISKFNPAGTLLFTTFLGGNNGEGAFGLAVTSSGAVHVAGGSSSTDFPTLGSQSLAHPNNINYYPFHAVLDPYSGSGNVALSWATTAPTQNSSGSYNDVVVDSSGRGYIFGNNAGVSKIYRIQPGAGILNTTTIQGDQFVDTRDLGIDAGGAVYVSGYTSATNLTTVNALQSSLQSSGNGFVAKIVYSGANAVIDYLTYVGGTQSTSLSGMAVMPSGKVILLGSGGAASPTPNGVPYNSSLLAVWLYALNPRGAGAVTAAYGTFAIPVSDMGGPSLHGLSADSQENLYISGSKNISNGYANCSQNCSFFNYFNFNARRLVRTSMRNGVPVKTALIDTIYGNFNGSAVSADRTRLAAVGESGYTQNGVTVSATLLEIYTQTLTPSIFTSPAGLQVQVDGFNNVTSGAGLNWIEGDEHTLEAFNQSVDGVRYAFSSWNEGGTQLKTVAPTGGVTYQANFTPVGYRLTVTKTGNGTVAGGDINCGATCMVEVAAANSVVNLSPTPAAGWAFTGWSGACSGTGACNVTMNAVKTVGASFVQSGVATTPGGPLLVAVVAKAQNPNNFNVRTWTLSITNRDTVPFTGLQLASFFLTQTGGAVLCPGMVQTSLPAVIGSIPSGGVLNTTVDILFKPANLFDGQTCPGNTRFTLNAYVSTDSGKSGSAFLLNQFQ